MAFSCRIILLFSLVLLFAGCKSEKKPSLSGDEPIEVGDFINFFPERRLPFQFSDTSSILLRKDKDSLLISYKVLTQFVPDSFLSKTFGKGVKPKFYPMGRARSGDDENYLFVKALSGNVRTALILLFNKKNQFTDGMILLKPDAIRATSQSAVVDSRLTLYKNVHRKNNDGTISEGKDVYTYDESSEKIILVMTDPLEDKLSELINPIDTFSRKQKYTADYGSGKMNLISIRDGRKKGMFTFFIHFEKNNGTCTGELKGDALIKSPTVAEYREAGEPCSLQFIFSSSTVTLKELGGCGYRRGLRCSFDGNYPRKKEPKSKPVGKKTSST